MMNSELIILIVSSIIITSFTIYAIIKKGLTIGTIFLSIMSISQIGAIGYFSIINYYTGLSFMITWQPAVYMLSMILIAALPLLKKNTIELEDISKYRNLINTLVVFISLVSIEPFLENLLLLLQNRDMSAVYDAYHNGELENYSSIGTRCQWFCYRFRLWTPVLFFIVWNYDSSKFMKYGISIAALNIFLSAYNSGSRGSIIVNLLLYLSCFLVLKPSLKDSFISAIKQIAAMSVIPIVLIFSVITISRFNNNSMGGYELNEWLLLYISEGPIKFNTEMWYMDGDTQGDVLFAVAKNKLGFKSFETDLDRDLFYSGSRGFRVEVFYSYIGDYVSDLGIIGGALVLIFISLYIYRRFRKSSMLKIYQVPIVIWFIHSYFIGFASNVYRGIGWQVCLMVTFLICIMFYICDKLNAQNKYL